MTQKRSGLEVAVWVTVTALVCLVVYVLAHAYPSSEAVRLRNALLIGPADSQVGDWSPEAAPPTFLAERMPVPRTIAAASARVLEGVTGSDLDKARALAAHLLAHAKDSGPIQSLDIERTYRGIVENGEGYCSDYINAFTALALAAGLPVRSWAFSFDGFGGHGHIVVEVFERAARRWVMLDIYNNVMPVVAATGATLSVREFTELFRRRETEIDFVPIGAGRVAYPIDAKLREYYRAGLDQWYLWNGNNVVSRGRGNVLVTSLGRVESLGELASIASGTFPRIVPLPSPTNANLVVSMLAVRDRLLVISVTSVVLCVLLVVELALLRWHKRPSQA